MPGFCHPRDRLPYWIGPSPCCSACDCPVFLSVGLLLDTGLEVLHMEGRREPWNSLDSTVPAVKLLTIASKCSSESWKPPYEGMRSVVARVALIRLMRPSLANPLATGMQKADPLFGIGL